jgi:hypothetical protein
MRPVMEIAGIPHELIGWSATRRERILAALDGLTDSYETEHQREPGERARYVSPRWST